MYIATLMNWDSANRKAGKSWIKVFDTVASAEVDPITVAPGQSARKAAEAAGWTVTSKPVQRKGVTRFTVERAKAKPEPQEAAQVPQLRAYGAERAVARLLGPVALA